METKDTVLPYRTTGQDVVRLVEARARGRELSQIQALSFNSGGFQGTLLAASALGFLDADSKELTPAGRELALAANEQKPMLVRNGLFGFEPYGLLLEAIFNRGTPTSTSVDWVQKWWSTHGFGNSQTNREEGASAFGRLLTYAGLGAFMIGRRGLSTRIDWSDDAPAVVKRLLDRTDLGEESVDRGSARREEDGHLEKPQGLGTSEQSQPAAARDGNSQLVLRLGPDKVVELSLPSQVTAAEKKRLLTMIDLMIEVEVASGDAASDNLT